MSCGCGKPKCDGKCGISPAVLQINNNECTLFRKVDVPASMGDSVTNPPKPGAYRNVLLYYQADETAYLYSSDGMFVKVTGSVPDYNTLINKPSINGVVLTGDRSLTALGITDAISSAVGDEAADRIAADNAIWDEIEIIEASSDVVDVVGTYADLQSYDTSKLHDNDLIKVLQDETHSDAITYYRWNKSAGTFSYVGEEGPYYTETEVNTLLSGKQDTLVAGSNIQIAADGKTISATDTTYSAGAGLDLTGTTFSVDTSVIAEVSDLPTKTSDLMNDGSDGTSTYVEADDLATVATTGDYDDLLNKPTIPTVNDATLTIQKNGTDVATFTANSSTNTTANIAVPTNTSDLTNDSHFISYDDSTICTDGKVLAISGAPANAPFASASIKGDTSQTGTPTPSAPVAVKTVTGENVVKICGKNLLDIKNNLKASDGGLNFSYSNDKLVVSGTPTRSYANVTNEINTFLAAGQYTLSLSEAVSHRVYIWVRYTDGAAASLGIINAGGTSTTTTFAKDVAQIRLDFSVITTGVALSESFSVQLEKGSSSSSFEPYQEQSYEVNLGKNLFDKDNANVGNLWINISGSKIASSGDARTLYIPCEGNTTYTVSKVQSARFAVATTADVPANDVATLESSQSNTATNITITTSSTAKYLCVFFYHASYDTLTPEQIMGTIQIEKGSTATTYAPYFTPIELCKIGTYQDYIYKDGSDWKIHKACDKYVFDSSALNWNTGSGTGGWVMGYNGQSPFYNKIALGTPSYQSFCSHFDFQRSGDTWTGDGKCGFNSGGAFWCRNSAKTTKQDFLDWLGQANPTVYYALATPTDTEITDATIVAQLNALANGYTYNPQTNIAAAFAVGNEQAILSICVPVDTLPVATTSRLGTVVIGDGIDVDNTGRISVTPPDPTDYYWADVKVSDASSQTTTPTVAQIYSKGSTYPHIGGGGTLTLSSGAWTSGDGTIALAPSTLRPANGKTTMDLGENGNKWRSLYMSGNIYTGSYTLTLPGATGTIALTSDIPGVFTGADAGTAGTSGIVPAPAAGDNTKFLAGDGTWKTVSIYSLPIASDTTLGGIKVGTNLTIDAGTGVLSATDTTYSNFVGATSGVAGSAGLVPAPTTSDPDKFLKGDGTWGTPPGTTYSAGTGIDITGSTIAVDTTTIAEVSDIPTKTSDLLNDGADNTSTYVETDELAAVATSGDYDDLLNKPTIPTVNNATLTIQKNGTDVQTFTANQSTNATANITVPTTVAELTDASDYATVTQATYTAGGHIDITSNVITAEGYVHSEDPVSAVTPGQTLSGSNITNNSITFDKTAAGEFLQLQLTTVDPGEGSPLAANTLLGVYQ